MTSTLDAARLDPSDPTTFRRVMGHYPSGVVAITSIDEGEPIGLIASSFTSVSMDPPLVAFYPQRTSTTWPRIRERGAFCVNVLGAEQEGICRKLASKGGDKFDGVAWSVSELGLPVIAGSVAWINCAIEVVYDAGDHEVVIGRVRDLDVVESVAPMLFFQGGYGRFASSSLTAFRDLDILEHLSLVESLRPQLRQAAQDLGVEVLVTGISGQELIVLTTSGHPDPTRLPTRVGQHMPYIPPLGGAMAAFDDPLAWLSRGRLDEETRQLLADGLRLTQERGWSATITTPGSNELEAAMLQAAAPSPTAEQLEAMKQVVEKLGADHTPVDIASDADYPLRSVTVPVLQPDGHARLALTVFGLPALSNRKDLDRYVARLQEVAANVQLPSKVFGEP